jgi:ankyrin repeat protein
MKGRHTIRSVDVATLLLERGADIASVDKDGFTSLHFAVLGNVDVRLFVEQQIDNIG